jgi:hypothetical protein
MPAPQVMPVSSGKPPESTDTNNRDGDDADVSASTSEK